ncbi:hypothetical protein [Flavobacterium sp. UBA6135]|uniref:hypothetical protein n=1 Tax=Flavobacterium sp. UBA6135 TaxID=1946553 RepID=UPI0025BCE200|nr:hypothetical protein [Flavobacterium sp. UBA6135]
MNNINNLLVLLLVVVFSSCKETPAVEPDKETTTTEKKNFEMYNMSEMALLMEQMYVDNERLKNRIINGEEVGEFPTHFSKIHSSIMTDPSENDAFFKEQSVLFLKAQEQIYADPENAETHYNNAIQACIRCHEVKCGGPIPRIKKLVITTK